MIKQMGQKLRDRINSQQIRELVIFLGDIDVISKIHTEAHEQC